MHKISVIIPVYNCEKHLEMCLNSIVFQTYENLEIICINDGSKDNSLKILKKYAKNDSRISIINQKNKGQSIARNVGIELATGDYISFIDSDDWVSLSLYEKFIKSIDSYSEKIDIYMFNACNYNEKQQDIFVKLFFDIKCWNNFQIPGYIHKFQDCKDPFTGNISACNKIYRTEFLKKHNLRFLSDLIFEDQLFYIQTFLSAKSILISNDIMYMYRQTNNSSTMNSLKNKVFDIFAITYQMEKSIKNAGNYDEYKYALFQHKYKQFSYLFFKTPLISKPRFYDNMKARLIQTKDENLNEEICKQLSGYEIYRDITKLNWFDFYKKYKNKII